MMNQIPLVTGSLCEIHRISYICSILRTFSVRCLRNSNGILIEYIMERRMRGDSTTVVCTHYQYPW